MEKSVAILYQAQPAPARDGIAKPMKEGGYSDSGADIAVALKTIGHPVCTPVDHPNFLVDSDWVFPDSMAGIENALAMGAKSLWLNTVLYTGHPIESFSSEPIWCIGQVPGMVDRYDNKINANNRARQFGLPVCDSVVFEGRKIPTRIDFPVMLKPIRGRGSQGVRFVTSKHQLEKATNELLDEKRFGSRFYLEPYLPGKEITVSVLPPGYYQIRGSEERKLSHWCLPPVQRRNHQNGIMPYSGQEPVSANSQLLHDNTTELNKILTACRKTAEILGAHGLLRIDCRADERGKFFIFDINMKPNLTGTSRSHRSDQESLTTIAAEGIGWSYHDLIENLARQQWSINLLLDR